MKTQFMWLPAGLFAFAALTATGTAASTQTQLPSPLVAEGFRAQCVGSGILKWFGLEIYTASLWTPDANFSGFGAEPVAFSLDYRRSFSRDRLIDITRTAWDELALASDEQQQRWSQQLASIWVDVRRGSNMTTLVLPSGETRFYSAEQFLGRIEDPAFGPAFLQIWLDERVADTALGKLRSDLLHRSARN
jgi:Chalcone isomerase-like